MEIFWKIFLTSIQGKIFKSAMLVQTHVAVSSSASDWKVEFAPPFYKRIPLGSVASKRKLR